MKKIILILIMCFCLVSYILPMQVFAEEQSTTVTYSVSATVIYVDYDDTQTTQQVEVGTILKAPGHKERQGYTFVGWKNSATGELWNFGTPVTEHLTLVAVYKKDASEEDGLFSLEIRNESDVDNVTIRTSKDELEAMLIQNGDITTEELAQIADGAEMEIVLVIKNGAATISDTSKQQMEAFANGYTIAQYIDISLYKYMSINGENSKEQQLHQTARMITVSIRIPDSLINTDTSIERSYGVLRNHDGVVELLNSTYDSATQTITFETNRFSDYAIIYKDVKKSEQTTNGKNDNKTPKDNSSEIKNSPKTGDTSHLSEYEMMFLFSAMIMVVLLYTKKKTKKA